MKLAELSSLIRSKNAGPFVLTFDIMFPDDKSYQRVKRAGVLSPRKFAELFHTAPRTVCSSSNATTHERSNSASPGRARRAIWATAISTAANNMYP